MLMTSKPHGTIGALQDPSGIESTRVTLDFEYVLAVARRQMRVIVLACVLGGAFGLAYLATAVPLYTSAVSVLIDNRTNPAVADASGTAGAVDSGAVDSQVEVIRSEKVAAAVVDKLQLLNRTDLLWGEPSLFVAAFEAARSLIDVSSWFLAPEGLDPAEQEHRKRAVVETLRWMVDVRRVARTYVIEISFTARDPAFAAEVANAYGNAYLTDQLESKYDSTRRAGAWLHDRIEELRRRSIESDLAVQRFKAQHNLIGVGGRLVSDQQLSELNSQLIIARSEVSRAEAKYQRIRAILDSGQTEALVSEALDHSVITGLRTKYLSASKRQSEIASRLGPNHVGAVSAGDEMRQYERLIFEELGRIGESYKSEFEVAKSKEQSLSQSLEGLVGVTAANNETLVSLRELEREAETYRTLYQNFLQRFQQATQQQSFPITEARIITSAATPTLPSSPKKGLVLALSLALGGGLGVAVGLLREYRDRFFRTGAQVRDELRTEFLGMLPMLAPPGNTPALNPTVAAQQRQITAPPVMRFTMDHPLSRYAETLRAAKVAADVTLQDETKVIGVVSMLPGEGKTATAKNFASLLAQQGARTLLIDADLRNPGLTKATAPLARNGLLEVLLEGRSPQDLLYRETETNLLFLPTVLRSRLLPHTSDILASAMMKGLLREMSAHFDYIIVDLPPLGPVVDVRAAASLFSGFLFVVEWGRTPRKAVRETLRSEDRIQERCLGVVLNKVDPEKLAFYESHDSKEFYDSRYATYYQEGQKAA